MTRDIVPKLLPSVAGHYLLRHIELPASSAELPDMPMPLPMGEVAPKVTERASRGESLFNCTIRLHCGGTSGEVPMN